jgi:hypothetical protein
VEDSDLDTETDDDEIGWLSCSLHKMSISSPSRSEGAESRKLPRHPGTMEERVWCNQEPNLRVHHWNW